MYIRVSLHLLGLEQLHRQQQLPHLAPQLFHLGTRLLGLEPNLVAHRDAVGARRRRCRARPGLRAGRRGPLERRRQGQGGGGRLQRRQEEERKQIVRFSGCGDVLRALAARFQKIFSRLAEGHDSSLTYSNHSANPLCRALASWKRSLPSG